MSTTAVAQAQDKILACMATSTTREQFDVCERMIDNFAGLYPQHDLSVIMLSVLLFGASSRALRKPAEA